MKEYQLLLKRILKGGAFKAPARENMPTTISLFGPQMIFPITNNFPIVTGKRMDFNNILAEFLWIIQGKTNIHFLVKNNCNIWNQDAYNYYLQQVPNDTEYGNMTFEEFVTVIKEANTEESLPIIGMPNYYRLGDCGELYGYQLRKTSGDQLKAAVEELKENPSTRRAIVNYWNPETIHSKRTALPPCHVMFQFNCREVGDDTYLDCLMVQRSGDAFLGIPYNISFYTLMVYIVAAYLGYEPGTLVIQLGDAHIYTTHVDIVNKYLDAPTFPLPKLVLEVEEGDNFDDFINKLMLSSFKLINYQCGERMPAPLHTGLIRNTTNVQ